MNNLCFLSNLSSGEWAQWASATGSFLAVAVAIWVALRDSRQRAESALIANVRVARSICDAVVAWEAAVAAKNAVRQRSAHSKLKDALKIGQRINLADLPPGSVAPTLRLRAVGVDVLARKNGIEADLQRWAGMRKYAEDVESELAALLEAVPLKLRT